MKYTKVTVSGKICTGKSTLYNQLIDTLHWNSFSVSQYFRKVAKKNKTVLETAAEQNDKLTKKIDYMVRDYLKTDKNYIIEGWMAGIMANNNPKVLRILLICDDKVRAERFAKRENVSLKDAKLKIKERESALFSKLQDIYHREDFVDKKNYNLVIDTTMHEEDKTLKMVLKRLQVNKL